ncbi:MAG: hypothetical protein BWY74_01571 [Firmicutes bacterium ADurb.Bin419]|nr:MAG: hypothetical protein BWY74_01571 [Firmicutes bacterium ADurb.Bin419]
MNKLNLKKIIKKCTLYYTLIGLAIGLAFFFLCVFNNNIPVNILTKSYYGVVAGLISLVLAPIIMAVFGFAHAVILWYPGIWLYNKIKYKKDTIAILCLAHFYN